MEHITVLDLLSAQVVHVTRDTPVVDVANLLRDQQVSCAIVDSALYADGFKSAEGSMDASGALPEGIVTEHDIVRSLSDLVELESPQSLCADDIMSSPVLTLNASSSLYEALALTQSRGIRHIPIVDDHNTLLGVVTRAELARSHFQLVEQQREKIEQKIRDRTAKLTEQNSALSGLALQDSLLGIGNQRALEVDVYVNHVNSARVKHTYALVMVEVDDYKHFISVTGEQELNLTLNRLSESIKGALRPGDRHYRYGDDCFALLMPNTGKFEVVEAMHRLAENIERLCIEHSGVEHPSIEHSNTEQSNRGSAHLTVSIGIGVSSLERDATWQEVLAEARAQLAHARDLGHNQVCFAVDDLDSRARVKRPLAFLFGGLR